MPRPRSVRAVMVYVLEEPVEGLAGALGTLGVDELPEAAASAFACFLYASER